MKLSLIMSLVLFTVVSKCSTLSSLSTSSESLNSISTSLNSISTALNSVSSISKSLASISDSSASEDDKKSSMYIRDVEQVTYLFLRGKISEWEENLQAISETYGYLTWKESPYSFVGIGRAIRKANISKQEYISFLQSLSKGNPRIRSLVAAGYQNKD